MHKNSIIVYTDGSCNPIFKVGGWASIIFIDDRKIVLNGIVENTTHQRMELQAIIESFEFIATTKYDNPIVFFSDSQYVVDIPKRKNRIQERNFITKGNKAIQNEDLLRRLICLLNSANVEFVKVKAHLQKTTDDNNYNREVDRLVRAILRKRVSQILGKKRNTLE